MSNAEMSTAEGGKKGAIVEAMMKHWHTMRWRPFLKLLGLTNENKIDRLVRLLVMHLLLDRAIMAGLTLRLIDHESPDFSKIEAKVAKVEMGKRIELAKAANIISDSCAKDIHAVNDVRNNFAHYQPHKGWELDTIQELSSAEAFEKCAVQGNRALAEAI